MKKISLIIFLLINLQALKAQTSHDVKGTVLDSTGLSVIAATIRLTSPKDTLQTRTDADGHFNFRNVKSPQFVLSVSSLGYSDFVRRYLFSDKASSITVETITLKAQSNVLNEVVITGAAPTVVVKQDTVEYRAKDFPVRENSVAEDVIKRLPGVEVDKDGNVTTQGKSITRVRVNGKDYFDGDLKSATQGLPADIIEKIQVIDDYGDQANITGIREGEADKIINITIRPDRMKGSVISGVAGGGNLDRYQASGSGQFMNQDQQIDVRLNLNNTNASPFNFDSGGGRGFGGGGSGNRGGGNDFSGQSGGGNFGNRGGGFGNSGISSTTAGGLNYRDKLSKKVSINGSYRFFVRNTDAQANTFRTSRFGKSESDVITSISDANTETGSNNHNANFNLEYSIDTLNYLRITPFFNIGINESDGLTNQIQEQPSRAREDQITNLASNSRSPSVGGNLIYNHRFKKYGRNFSLGLNLNNSNNDSDRDVNDLFRYYNSLTSQIADSNSHRLIETTSERMNANANITYSEPIGKLGRIDLGYNYSVADYNNSRITNIYNGDVAVIDNNLSNIYDYSFYTNRFSLNYRFAKPKAYSFTIGVTAQPTQLRGYSVTNDVSSNRSGFNLFPTARFDYSLGRTRSLTVNYGGRSNEPGFNQIQPVTDVSNPLRPVVGNPDLNSAFTQFVNVRYNTTNTPTGFFFNTGIFANITNDQITRNIVRYQEDIVVNNQTTKRTIQETNYLNVDGYYSTNAFYSVGKSFLQKKYRLSLNGSLGYLNDVSFTNSQRNVGKNWTLAQSVRVQINPNKNIEIYPAIGYRSTSINYSIGDNDVKAQSWNYDLNGKLYFLKSLVFGFDLSKNVNQGYSSIKANPFIISTYLEKQFLNRRGAFRIQGYDLLNEGTVVAISQDANTITNSQTNRLTRYFMATLSFRIQKFPGGVQPEFNRNQGSDVQPR
jgi:hypothetical protein